MTHHTATKKNIIAARQLESVRVELSRAKAPLRASDLANAAGCDVQTTTAMLVRLRGQGLAWEAGKTGYTLADGKTASSKTITLWAWHTLRPSTTAPANTPHKPSNQPNGSPEFWAKHMAQMNAPARLELQR
jgi:hypothetical protein